MIFNMLFGKKQEKSREDIIAESTEVKEVEQEKKEEDLSTGNAKIDMEITKVKGQLDALNEVRKAHTDRFSRVSEQMGEIRGMITDLSKTISKIEVGATKAVDLVDSVKPEKLMIEVRKQDAKTEAVRAQLESTQARMKDMLDEMKKIREQMNVYKGLDQVVKMNDEMKEELSEMRKMQVNIEKHADRVETMFLEVNKKFVEFDKFNDVVKDMKRQFDKMTNDMEKFKVKLEEKAEKKEFVNLVDRFSDFQKHTDNVLKLLDERSKSIKEDANTEVERIKKIVAKKYEIDLEAAEKAIDEQEEKQEAGEGESIISKVKGKLSGSKDEDGQKKEPKEDRSIVDKGLDDKPEEGSDDAPEKTDSPEEKNESSETVQEKTESSEAEEKPADASEAAKKGQPGEPPEYKEEESADQDGDENEKPKAHPLD